MVDWDEPKDGEYIFVCSDSKCNVGDVVFQWRDSLRDPKSMKCPVCQSRGIPVLRRMDTPIIKNLKQAKLKWFLS